MINNIKLGPSLFRKEITKIRSEHLFNILKVQ